MSVKVILNWLVNISENDYEQMKYLINETLGDGGTVGFSKLVTDNTIKQFMVDLKEGLSNGSKFVLLGKTDLGEPASLVILTKQTTPNCQHIAELSKGIVNPKYRGSGLVKETFKKVVEKAQEVGIDLLTLDVRQGSKAYKLWEWFGFRTYGVLEDYARIDGNSFAGSFMFQTVKSLEDKINNQMKRE